MAVALDCRWSGALVVAQLFGVQRIWWIVSWSSQVVDSSPGAQRVLACASRPGFASLVIHDGPREGRGRLLDARTGFDQVPSRWNASAVAPRFRSSTATINPRPVRHTAMPVPATSPMSVCAPSVSSVPTVRAYRCRAVIDVGGEQCVAGKGVAAVVEPG